MKFPRISTPPVLRLATLKVYLRYLASTDKPILVGPFRSEFGFEVLYWIPFLNWCVKHGGLKPERLIAVTRGGAGALYPAAKSVDLFSLRTVEQFRLANKAYQQTHKLQKQMHSDAWDREVLQEAAERTCGAGARYQVLHPSWMYWAFEPFWEEQRGLTHLKMMDFSPIQAPPCPIEGLPAQYVVARFYHRATFPDSHPTRDFVARMLARIAQQVPVVLLSQPQLHADDHWDIPVPEIPNVIRCPELPAERNLEFMASIMGGAQAFVGTYGGFAQLALRMGKPSLSFWQDFHSTAHAHRDLNQNVAILTKVPFVTMSVREAALCKMALREVVVAQPTPAPEPEPQVAA